MVRQWWESWSRELREAGREEGQLGWEVFYSCSVKIQEALGSTSVELSREAWVRTTAQRHSGPKALLTHQPSWTTPWEPLPSSAASLKTGRQGSRRLVSQQRAQRGGGRCQGARLLSLHHLSVPLPTSGACAPRCGGKYSGCGFCLCGSCQYLRGRTAEW